MLVSSRCAVAASPPRTHSAHTSDVANRMHQKWIKGVKRIEMARLCCNLPPGCVVAFAAPLTHAHNTRKPWSPANQVQEHTQPAAKPHAMLRWTPGPQNMTRAAQPIAAREAHLLRGCLHACSSASRLSSCAPGVPCSDSAGNKPPASDGDARPGMRCATLRVDADAMTPRHQQRPLATARRLGFTPTTSYCRGALPASSCGLQGPAGVSEKFPI